MTAPDPVDPSALIDDARCLAPVRRHRWPEEGVRRPGCGGAGVVRDGRDETRPRRQRCRRKACAGRLDDLGGTVPAGHHRPPRAWVLCLYLMGLNLSSRRIAREPGLDGSDARAMTEAPRGGPAAKAPPVRLGGEVEIDEVHVVAGPKGQPAAVAERGGSDAAAGRRAGRAAARRRRTGHRSSA